MAQTPLAPYYVKTHLDLICRPHWVIPNTVQKRSMMRPHRIKILYGALEDRDAFSRVCNTLPWLWAKIAGRTCTTPCQCFLDEGFHRLEKDDVGHEMEEDILRYTADACTDVQSSCPRRVLGWTGVERRWDCG
jgi:hypothetical protein